MEKELLFGALDRAITKVADDQYKRLSNKISRNGLNRRVHQYLNFLSGLQQGNPPNYNDPWIALFYLTWYQPKQIHLAHSLIEEQKRIRNTNSLLIDNSQSLHVIDFGCGSLAMKFAVVWAVAEALESGEQISSVTIDSYDANLSMIQLGISLWDEFKVRIQNTPKLVHLFRAINMVKGQCATLNHAPSIKIDNPSTVWLSAIHTVYKNNTRQVKTELANLSRITNPNIGFLSVHNHAQQSHLLPQISPFVSTQYNRQERTLSPKYNDVLPAITQWRRNINTKIPQQHPFLSSSVTWAFSNALGWIYIRS